MPNSPQRSLAAYRRRLKRPSGLKALLASAPLEGIDLARRRDRGRDIDL
jgi:hypothetical protein